jgi:hypothetical protein
MIPRAVAVWLGICAVIVVGRVASSDATFTAQKANPGSSFAAAASIPGMRLASGTYTGNGANPRTISGLAFAPDVVIVKGNNTQPAVIRTATMSGDASKPMIGASGLTANLVESLGATSFTVGNDSRVNASGTAYTWIAMKSAGGALAVGTYSGNGTSQSISGLGFSPEAVTVLPSSAQRAQLQISGMTRTFQYDANTGITNGITALGADGFSVASSATVNSASTTYHYLAWNQVAGAIDAGGYTGNGSDNRSISVPFQPQYAIVRSADTATSREGAHRPSALTGSASLNYTAAANDSNSIQALQSSGFQVGTDGSVNASGAAYRYLAFRDQP